MKNKNLVKAICLSVILMSPISWVKAQMWQAVSGNNYATTLQNTDKVGIGTNTTISSMLQVDGSSAYSVNTGELFRTIAPSSTASYWRLLRMVSGTPTEFGTIYNNADNHFYLEAVNGGGDMIFQTGGANGRMIIKSGGNVGIGNFTAPSRLLDVFGSANSPQFRISYDASNYTDFKARSNGNLIINPLSSGPTAMKVGIGNFATSDDPTNKLEVVDGGGDPQLRLSYTHGTLSTIFETNVDGDLRIASTSGLHGINVNPNTPGARM
ncbi:MAG: hypothetical protein IPO83_03360 [Chitinophagaceae bacterium]|nr:hypothetical protein [Chitinophagaceae bacterium]